LLRFWERREKPDRRANKDHSYPITEQKGGEILQKVRGGTETPSRRLGKAVKTMIILKLEEILALGDFGETRVRGEGHEG